jgi:vacuolar protein sorting-associated protein 13A/C
MKEFVLSKIDMRFSFHKRFRNNSQFEENVFNLFSTAIGATVQNFNEAEIILDCFRLRSVYDSKEIVL